jgi:hypothetical protein
MDSEEVVKRSVEGSAAVGAGQDQKEKREEEKEAGRGTSSRERGRLLASCLSRLPREWRRIRVCCIIVCTIPNSKKKREL